jgi:hypothetical protein
LVAIHRAGRTPFWGYTLAPAPVRIALRPDVNVQLAVGYYREGLNAGGPFYAFLALWNALDAAFSVTDRDTAERLERDEFIRDFARSAQEAWDHCRYPFPDDLAIALEQDSRNAIAHVLRRPGRRVIDPDSARDRDRLRMESDVLKWMVHDAVERKYPGAVEVEHD